MKKALSKIFSFAFVSCMALGVSFLSTNVDAKAETQNDVFTETKCQISLDVDRMLIVTGIKDASLVYELGYEINGEFVAQVGDTAETDKYYTSLTLGDDTKLASEFAEGAIGLLIWEIAYDETVEYTIKPYAYVGEMQNGQLIAPDNNEKSYGDEKANFNVFNVTFKDENGETLKTESVNYGEKATAPSVQEKVGYTFDGWYNGEDKMDLTEEVTGDLTLTAKYTANENTAYKVNVYQEKLMGGGYDLVTTLNANGVTDTNVSIEDVEMPTMPSGFVVNAKTSVTEGTVAGDGTTELSVYWDYQTPTAVNNWTTWYDATTATMGTNPDSGQYAGAVQFITNSNKVYLAGQFVYETFGFQGFVISSGDTYRFFALRSTGFNVWKVNYTASNNNVVCDSHVDSYNIADKRNGADYSTEVLNTTIINAIAGSAANKQPNAQLTIVGDIMQVWYEGVLCLKINLTQYGFTAGSNYNVGFMKPNHNGMDAGFTVNSIEVRTGSVVDEIVTELAK